MSMTIVVLVAGEALANRNACHISDQWQNAQRLADGLLPLLASGARVALLHGNKPQVGFVLYRSELASHALHPIPLDICGADTQGATGYMLSQSLRNAMEQQGLPRRVLTLVTQTLVEANVPGNLVTRAVGPYFDREKAQQYRQTRGWTLAEEPGRGYRRAVPALPPQEILEIDIVRHLVDAGDVVIAGGGGGIPVVRDANRHIRGIEAVVETEQVAVLMACQLKAAALVMILENDAELARAGLAGGGPPLSRGSLEAALRREDGQLHELSHLRAAAEYLRQGGEQVLITTLAGLPQALARQGGLYLGTDRSLVNQP